jgi:hypothetical protein
VDRTIQGCDGNLGELEELRRYTARAFDPAALASGAALPLPDEPFVAFWEARAAEAQERGAVAVLAEHLPQLRFPVREGISETAAYRDATRRGVPPAEIAEATGLELARPDLVELVLHPSPAGRIPLLIARGRDEFVALLRALAGRNEPRPVLASQGALMVSGYSNWSRLTELRRSWEKTDPAARETATWSEEMARLAASHRDLYQDRFILLSDGPYSAVPAAALGLSDEAWREASLLIRRDHECAHYLTRRLFGSMQDHALDELIADYRGVTAAAGAFRADWFLRFLGLEDFPRFRPGGRLEVYRGKPPLSDGAFRALQGVVKAAAENVERFDAGRGPEAPSDAPPDAPDTERRRTLTALAIGVLGLDRLAAGADTAVDLLRRTVDDLGEKIAGDHRPCL